MPDRQGYSYSGWCARCRVEHTLERTGEAVVEARRLAAELEHDPRFGGEGKMFGVLVGNDELGRPVTLRAFSGMLDGRPFAEGFVGPTRSGHLTARHEREGLTALSSLSAEIEALDIEGARSAVERVSAPLDQRIDELESKRRINKRQRDAERRRFTCRTARADELDALSQRERSEIRSLRRARDVAVAPLREKLEQLHAHRRELRHARRRRSRELQAAMHAAHGLLNFAGHYALLEDLFGAAGIPSGTGECCAPKLLQEAALRGIRPSGMAELWSGSPPPDQSKITGELYPACQEKCVPLLGHLLCRADDPRPALKIIFEDAYLVVVDKPTGLLSVPGRAARAQDCVETRLHLLRPNEPHLRAVHRLDQATSGVLVIARDAQAQRSLSRAFASGSVTKVYHAIVDGRVDRDSGRIELPLRGDPCARPLQIVDPEAGKQSSTIFRVLERRDRTTLLELQPLTGRTHQLRVHCASPLGLSSPILGDAIYGDSTSAQRLMLHASSIELEHPVTGARLRFESPPVFSQSPTKI